jgi:cytochrome c oxidase assembly protein subunit 19
MGSWQQYSLAIAPERGAFPLDLEQKCKGIVEAYVNCVKANKGNATVCRQLSKSYIKCRMDNNLMQKDELVNLGFHASEDNNT